MHTQESTHIQALMKFYDCKVSAVKEGKFEVHFKSWKDLYDEWLLLDCQRNLQFTSVHLAVREGIVEQLGECSAADAS